MGLLANTYPLEDSLNIISIDPGKTGAFALWVTAGQIVVHCEVADWNHDPKSSYEKLEEWETRYGKMHCAVMEDVGRGWTGTCIKSVASFARTCGMWDGFLAYRSIPVEFVPVNDWMAYFRIPSKKSKSDKPSLPIAREVFKNISHIDLSLKKHHDRGEALLIGKYYLERVIWKNM